MNNFINTLQSHIASGENKQTQPWLNWVVEVSALKKEAVGTLVTFCLRCDRGLSEGVATFEVNAVKPAAIIAALPAELVEALSAYELESGHEKVNSLEEALQKELS
jgi:hypothetical protein